MARSDLAVEIQRRIAAGERKPPIRKRIKMRPPDQQQRDYLRLIRDEIDWLRDKFDPIIDAVPDNVKEAGIVNAWQDDLETEADAIEAQIDARQDRLKKELAAIGLSIILFNKAEHERAIRNWFGVPALWPMDPIKQDMLLKAYTIENAKLIKNVSYRAVSEVSTLVLRNVSAGGRPREIKAEIQQRLNVSQSRAELIARDQSNKLYGQASEERQKEVGVEKYVWQTSNDERVRTEHEERDGDTFSWDDPPDDGHPGEAVQCRCTAEPDLEEIL